MRIIVFTFLLLSLHFPGIAFSQTFGQGVTLTDETAISDVIDNPEQHVGKTVRVSGLVVDVCSKRGCWVYLAGDREFEKIRVKVTDGEIVFPMEARGKFATVEGVVESMELSKEDVIARRQHHAEETGRSFDPATVTSGETVLQIRGLGAEIPNL